MTKSKLSFSEPEIQALFGHEAAEDENPERLHGYYFKTSTYDKVATDLPLRILVGHKGIGKSALFQVAIAEDQKAGKIAVLVKPDDIADLRTDTSDFLQAVRLWKQGLVEIIAGKVLSRFGESSDDIKAKLKGYGGRILDFLKTTLNANRRGDVSLTAVNQLLLKHFLKDGVITVYIDDLDQGWEGKLEDVRRVSAVLNAVRDVANENKGIRFRISLRSDVYYLVRTSDESTDKIEGSVIWQTWTNHEIFVMLVKRFETFFGRPVNERKLLHTQQRELASYLNPVIESRFAGSGKWENAPMYRILMSLIRKRPRDLVKLCTLAARKARDAGHTRINTSHFRAIFEEYSQGRIQDTINEFRSELPDIERLIFGMKPNRRERHTRDSYVYTTSGLLRKLANASQSGEYHFVKGSKYISASPRELAAFLYKINFLTARKETHGVTERRYFEENRYLSNQFADFGYDWEVHPAYRWALQPDHIQDIFATTDLIAE